MSGSPELRAVDEVLAAAPPSLRELAADLMGAVRKLHPEAYVTAWPRQNIIGFGFGPKKMSEHYVYIAVQSKHVNAGFYYGAALPDPSSILEGTGKNFRHVKVRTLREARAADLLALLAAARDERAAALK